MPFAHDTIAKSPNPVIMVPQRREDDNPIGSGNIPGLLPHPRPYLP